jgi:octaprenyl-diphosphate synthase
MTVDRLRALVKEEFDAVNTVIIDNIQLQVGLINDLSQHIVESGGKRLRPLLVLLGSYACGYKGTDHIDLAAGIEFFHTATLLHDDVVDESMLRRGRKTAHSIWGSKASVLVGDYLFSQSVQIMVAVGKSGILKLLGDTLLQITCGEVKQLANRNNPALSVEDYFEVIRSKTAILFAASACIGPILSESSQEVQNNLYAYGLHLGNAFQLIDDALDYCGDPETLGKNIGDDLADGKATLPLIHALQYGNPKQQQQIKQSLEQGGLEYLPDILDAIEQTNAIQFTQNIAAREIDTALSALSVLPESIYKQALIDLAHFALDRTY